MQNLLDQQQRLALQDKKLLEEYKSEIKDLKSLTALMSRLWTGFFGTERCRTPKIFQNPDFSLKRRDFWVFV